MELEAIRDAREAWAIADLRAPLDEEEEALGDAGREAAWVSRRQLEIGEEAGVHGDARCNGRAASNPLGILRSRRTRARIEITSRDPPGRTARRASSSPFVVVLGDEAQTTNASEGLRPQDRA